MFMKFDVHKSSPKEIELQLSMKILNVYVIWKRKLINCPLRKIFSHRESHPRIRPPCDVNRIVGCECGASSTSKETLPLDDDWASESVAGL
jgi:hypothetical protein